MVLRVVAGTDVGVVKVLEVDLDGKVSLPVYRYPMPAAVPSRSWQATFGDDNVPLVRVSLRRGSRRWTLRLRDLIREKADAKGIAFELADASDVETAEVLERRDSASDRT